MPARYMPDRNTAINRFLAANDWKPEDRSILADDASFRSYERLNNGTRQAVLMNAPPPHEDTRPFIRVAAHLRKLGLSAPEIYAADTDLGFLLLEDFGDATYTQVLRTDPKREWPLYERAVDVLIHMHKLAPEPLNPKGHDRYTTAFYQTEVEILLDWYLPQIAASPLPPEAIVSYHALWQELFEFTQTLPPVLVLRDYHVDNLVWLANKAGINCCGILDFQGALIGSQAYDLMSLLEDARRDVSPELTDHLRRRYFAAFDKLAVPGHHRDAFEAAFAVVGAGRHAKVIGLFTRLSRRDGKSDYLPHIARVWRLLERSLSHPMLSSLADWFNTYIPQNLRTLPADLAKEDK